MKLSPGNRSQRAGANPVTWLALSTLLGVSVFVGGCADAGSTTQSAGSDDGADDSSTVESDQGDMMAGMEGGDPNSATDAMPDDAMPGDAIPGDENSTDPLPGEENSTDPLPGEENYTDAVPGDENSTDPLPGDENSTDPLPGDENSTDPLPGEENYTDAVPGDENSTDPLPGDENSTDPLPGDGGNSAPEGTTDALPGDENGFTPDGGLAGTGGELDSEGGGQPRAPEEGSPEFPAFQLVVGLRSGNLKDIGKYISSRARGDLVKIRAGKLSDEEKASFKKTFERPELTTKPRSKNGGRQISLKSGEKFISILVKKEGSAWKVSELTIRTSTKR
jgi:hypothetical protein